MFIKRENSDDCIIAGYVILDQKEKEFEGREFIEVAVNVGKNSQGEDLPLINITVWRKLFPFKKGDHVIAAGKLRVTKKDDKTYYSMNAEFIAKEEVFNRFEDKPAKDLTPIDDDSLPF